MLQYDLETGLDEVVETLSPYHANMDVNMNVKWARQMGSFRG